MTIHSVSKLWVALLVGGLCAGGCGGGAKKVAGPTVTGNEDLGLPAVDAKLCDTKGKKVALFDLNQDGKPDVWKLTEDAGKGDQPTCKQVDLNHDGKKDFVTQYDEAGKIVLEEYDFDFDGKIDARVHFDRKTGRKVAAERVASFGERPDVWEKYGDGESLEAMRRDRNGDGKPDYWEQYLGGNLDKILYDDDFDGKVDRKEEARPGRGLGAVPAADEGDAATPAAEAPPVKAEEPPMEPGEVEEPPSEDEEK